ncbi:Molecular chaperone IbpA, HSP20 family [Nonomuraea maritima]|uniref:Molecular chaperone IbpA, HSP20 family n=2 Tax=Nonomuraea maritima TaxID=683260 RepID=A0A1G9BMI9_9ACTN|nr:Molecular chaperone IbpA, HSP20 family [Nonomuraea maritima]
MGALERWGSRTLFPDLAEFFESPLSMLRTAESAIRIEDYVDDGKYVIRAELPGVDPERDVEITVSGGVLRLHAERHEEQKEANRSEFRYGSLSRSLTLPEGVEAEDIRATYDKGILTVTVPMPEETKKGAKRIPVEA